MDLRDRRRALGLTQVQVARAAAVSQPNLSAYETGRRTPSPAVRVRLERALAVSVADRLEQHREAIRTLVTRHHAAAPRVFGSVARGDEEPASDLDLLVDFTSEATLLDEVGLRLALADLLQVPVDVVGSDTLRGPLRDRVLGEAVPV